MECALRFAWLWWQFKFSGMLVLVINIATTPTFIREGWRESGMRRNRNLNKVTPYCEFRFLEQPRKMTFRFWMFFTDFCSKKKQKMQSKSWWKELSEGWNFTLLNWNLMYLPQLQYKLDLGLEICPYVWLFSNLRVERAVTNLSRWSSAWKFLGDKFLISKFCIKIRSSWRVPCCRKIFPKFSMLLDFSVQNCDVPKFFLFCIMFATMDGWDVQIFPGRSTRVPNHFLRAEVLVKPGMHFMLLSRFTVQCLS